MAKQCSLPWEETREYGEASATNNFMEATARMNPAGFTSVEPELGSASSKPTSILLNLEDLPCFEVVERQFQRWGISFRNAIALHPSNPAYPPHSGSMVLMAAPKSGFLEILCQQPVRFFSCYVTSSQRTILSAYDSQDKILARAEMPGANLAGSDSQIPANAPLMLRGSNIYRITFYAFDGQLIVDDLSFGF